MHGLARDSARQRWLIPAAVLMLAMAYGAYGLLQGDEALHAFFPGAAMLLQMLALSTIQKLAQQRRWPRRVATGLSVLLSLGFGLAFLAFHPGGSEAQATPGWALLAAPLAGLGIWGFWTAAIDAPASSMRERMRTLADECERRKAELARLRSSAHPQFILKTLNAEMGLVPENPREARQLMGALGNLMRDWLEEEEEQRTLGQEIEWLRRYAEIFEICHRGSVRFEWELAPDTLAARVPRLLLQPLLENAVQQGALCRAGGGMVSVASRMLDRAIQIIVKDDGPGMEPGGSSAEGLQKVWERLQLADPRASMVVDSTSAGTRVTLKLPVQQA